MAIAIIKPPKKRKIIELADGAAELAIGATPSTGNKTTGKSAVAGMGIASLIHHVAIRRATAVVFHASGPIPSGAGKSKTRIKSNGPA